MKENTKENGVLDDPLSVFHKLGWGVGGPLVFLRDAFLEYGCNDDSGMRSEGAIDVAKVAIDGVLDNLNHCMKELAKAAGHDDEFKPDDREAIDATRYLAIEIEEKIEAMNKCIDRFLKEMETASQRNP